MEGFKKLSLDGKVAVVTGSTAGIGAATALLMAMRGARLTIHGRRSDRLEEMSQNIEKISGHIPFTVMGDIESPKVREELIDGTMKYFGRIDILVNNAGWAKFGDLDATDVSDLQQMLDIHVVAPFDLCKRTSAELIKNKGNIIMVSSVAGVIAHPQLVAYSAAKAALDNMMRSLSGDLGSKGVRVNSVNPGGTETEIFRTDEAKSFIKKVMESGVKSSPNPIGRMAEAEEIAEVICYLASEAAAMVNGSVTCVDGGKIASMF